MALTAEQVKNNLVNQILQNFPTAEVDTGSVLRDILIDPQSIQIANLSEEIDYNRQLNTFVQNASNILDSDLDEIGATFGVSRKTGDLATGLITFQATTRPTEDIQIGADDGSGGISVKTLTTENGNTYEFVTTETVYMRTDATYNEEHNCYEVSAPIRATTSGTVYNVGIGTIKILTNGIANITGVYNYVPTSGGTNRQENESYALSIQDAILGASKNIESGVDAILKSIPNVTEVKTLHPNSKEEPTKPGYSISYVRGSTESIVNNYTFTYTGNVYQYRLPKTPVTRIISIVAFVNGVQKTLVKDIDYSLTTDSNSIYANTIYSNDCILILGTNNGTPDIGTDVTVSYAYNSLISDCQDTLDEESANYLILGNLLVAQAEPIIIDIGTNIKLKYNYNTEPIKVEILNGLFSYIEGLKLGQDITQEDVFTYLTTNFSTYISSITYPFNIFYKRGEQNTLNSLTFTYGEYASLDANSLHITFE